MRDEEDRESELRLEIVNLLQDLALHDDVESGRRLVHDHELRIERERHRDDHALPHSAGELVGVGPGAPLVDPHEVEQLAGPLEGVALRDLLVRAHHVDELIADPRHRIERVHRALEDHRDVAPAIAAQLLLALPDQVFAAEENAATGDRGRRAQDLNDAVRDRRLAAAGLARETEDLARDDRQVDAVDRDDVAIGDVEIADLDERLALGVRDRRQVALGHCHFDFFHFDFFFAFVSARRRGLLTSSIPASRKTSPTTVITRARPGKRNGHHSPCRTVEFVWAQ